MIFIIDRPSVKLLYFIIAILKTIKISCEQTFISNCLKLETNKFNFVKLIVKMEAINKLRIYFYRKN